MHLALEQERVQDRAVVADRVIAGEPERAGLRIDLDLADVTAVREGRPALVLEAAGGGEPAAQLLGQILSLERGPRHLVKGQAAIGPCDGEAPVGEADVGGGRFEQVRRDLLALLY